MWTDDARSSEIFAILQSGGVKVTAVGVLEELRRNIAKAIAEV